MRVHIIFKTISFFSIGLILGLQGCSTTNYYSDSEIENFENNQKRTEAKKRVDSASTIRTVPNRRPQSITNSKKNKGKG